MCCCAPRWRGGCPKSILGACGFGRRTWRRRSRTPAVCCIYFAPAPITWKEEGRVLSVHGYGVSVGTAAFLQSDPTGPPLTLQPEDGPVSVNPKTVGAPSVKRAMYFISAVEVFSVALHFRMACSVFVKPPEYAMPLTAAFAATSSVSPDVMKAWVANSTTLNSTVFFGSIVSVRLPMISSSRTGSIPGCAQFVMSSRPEIPIRPLSPPILLGPQDRCADGRKAGRVFRGECGFLSTRKLRKESDTSFTFPHQTAAAAAAPAGAGRSACGAARAGRACGRRPSAPAGARAR